MSKKYRLSINTKDYLSEFYDILNEMIRGMTDAELTNSVSHNFIVQMIPHHRAAIEMSHNLLKYTTFIPLQDIALNIIQEQTESIKDMREIQYRCSEQKNTRQDLHLYQHRVNQIMHTMFFEMENAPAVNDINTNFMTEMIPHHRGAIRMSKNALQYDICPELKPILDAIITSQEKGVMQMQNLLKTMRH